MLKILLQIYYLFYFLFLLLNKFFDLIFLAEALYLLYNLLSSFAEIRTFFLTSFNHISKLIALSLVPVKKLTSRSENASTILKLFSVNSNNLLILTAPFINLEIVLVNILGALPDPCFDCLTINLIVCDLTVIPLSLS